MRSFADPDTHFRVLRSDTPVTVDGVPLNAPTGDVECDGCGMSASNLDEISHEEDCPQRFVHSRWYATAMENDR